MTGWRDRGERDFGAREAGTGSGSKKRGRWLVWLGASAVLMLIAAAAVVVTRPPADPAAVPSAEQARSTAQAIRSRLDQLSGRIEQIRQAEQARGNPEQLAAAERDVAAVLAVLDVLDEHKRDIAEFEKRHPGVRRQLNDLAKRLQAQLERRKSE